MNSVLSHNSALQGYTGPGITWTNDTIFFFNHAPGAGSIVRPVDRQSSALPLCHGHPPYMHNKAVITCPSTCCLIDNLPSSLEVTLSSRRPYSDFLLLTVSNGLPLGRICDVSELHEICDSLQFNSFLIKRLGCKSKHNVFCNTLTKANSDDY